MRAVQDRMGKKSAPVSHIWEFPKIRGYLILGSL